MSIKKLTGDAFLNIKSGLTYDELSKTLQKTTDKIMKKYKVSYENIGDIKNKVYDDILNNDRLKDTSKRIYSEAYANLLLSIDKEKYKKFAQKIFLMGIEVQTEYDKSNENQIMTKSEKQNFVCFDDVVFARDVFKNNTDFKEHLTYLILCINTYLPPIRHNFLNMPYFTTEPENQQQYNNYIYKNMLVINKDKVSKNNVQTILNIKTYKTSFKKEVYINGTLLLKIVKDSLKKYPRKYILSSLSDKNKPMSNTTYDTLLKNVFQTDVRQNILRKSYINYWYDSKNKLTLKEKKIIAKFMRNSVGTAMKSYEKIDCK